MPGLKSILRIAWLVAAGLFVYTNSDRIIDTLGPHLSAAGGEWLEFFGVVFVLFGLLALLLVAGYAVLERVIPTSTQE